MEFIPQKQLTMEEIESVLTNPDRFRIVDPLILLHICQGGPLYKALWVLSCVAIVLAREYMERLPEPETLLEIFHTSGTKYLGITLLNLGVEIDAIENLTREEKCRVAQLFFEKVIVAVNEALDGEQIVKFYHLI